MREKNKIQLRIRYLFVATALLIVFVSGEASADSDKASQLYSRAQEAYSNQEYAEAVDYLKQAYREDPDLVYKYNQIVALGKLGREEEALRLLREYEHQLKRDERIQNIAELEKRLRDDLQTETSSQREARKVAENIEDAAEDVILRSRLTRRLSEQREPPKRGLKNETLGWALIGLSGASLATAGLLELGVFLPEGYSERRGCWQKYGSFARCYDDTDTQRFEDIQSEARNSTLKTTFLVVGITSAVGGTLAFVLDSPPPKRETQSKAIKLKPSIGTDSARAIFEFSF